MGSEASKTKQLWTHEFDYLKGKGIDIGCGSDPILPNVKKFDQEDGDANEIEKYISEEFDFVFSSHCLEHMHDPFKAFQSWYNIVKPGGYMITLVPDEDLYEQGTFPSLFNEDHKHTFTICKAKSWSDRSVNVLDLVKHVGAELIDVRLQDNGYDRSLMRHNKGKLARLIGRRFRRLAVQLPMLRGLIFFLFKISGGVMDQTNLNDFRLAQIQFIIRKPLA